MNPAPSSTLPASPTAGREPLLWVFGLIGLLWLQLFLTLIPTWRDGEYYEYGWFVPPLAIGLAWNRWQWLKDSGAGHLRKATANPQGSVMAVVVLALLALIPLRIVLHADPYWRSLLLAQALIVIGLTHLLLGHFLRWKTSLAFLPVSIYALTAVPYPTAIEKHLISHLTQWVSVLACELFLLSGKPVELMGERLVMGREVVSVNEDCSGIRSLQSLVMVALFFGEMLLLSIPRRIVLLLIAASCALIVNTLRAYHLANIHFTQGKDAFDQAHDMVGHVAFACSAAILYLSARLMLSSSTGSRKVRRILVTSPNPHPP